MKAILVLIVLGTSACATTYVAPPDPTPVIGAQLIGRNGECVDVQDGGTVDGTAIVVVRCHGSPNEHWFIRSGIISESFASCIDVQGAAPNEGSPIVLVTCSGSPSQQWSVVGGQIIGLGNKCLTEAAGATADQTPLILSSCRAAPGQIWTIQ